MNKNVTDNISELLCVFPEKIKYQVISKGNVLELMEVVMDLGRPLEIRYTGETVRLDDVIVSDEDINTIASNVGQFGDDNRAGIEKTLHRISAIRNRYGKIVGLTCRVGRAVYGTIDIIRDIIEKEKSILIMGRPGIGKTTKLREIARIMADEFGKRVIIIDTSNEIAGDGDIPHPSIGHARRMQVSTPLKQESVMIEAVENHMPEVVVIDEISTKEEAFAARTIAERGVMLVATAHGQTLENLIVNPSLSDLVGGIQTVTLSDDEAMRRGTQKSVQERMAQPTFDIIIEILDMDRVAIHKDTAKSVDDYLRGQLLHPQIRMKNKGGSVKIVQDLDPYSLDEVKAVEKLNPVPVGKVHRILPYGISRNKLEKAIISLNLPARIVRHKEECDSVITIKNYDSKSEYTILSEMKAKQIPVYVIKSNTTAQITQALKDVFDLDKNNKEQEALAEVIHALESLDTYGGFYDLMPQDAYIRRIQHQKAKDSGYYAESIGNEPYRRLRIFEKNDHKN